MNKRVSKILQKAIMGEMPPAGDSDREYVRSDLKFQVEQAAAGPSEENVLSCLRSTWESISPDFFPLNGKNTCKGKVLQQIVPDYIGLQGWRSFSGKQMSEAWRKMERLTQDALLERAFPAKGTFGF